MAKYNLEVLRAMGIKKVAEKLGIKVRHNSACCFLHDDSRPSLAFSKVHNTWWCYVCEKGGDVISLVQAYHNCSFPEACQWLCDNYEGEMPVVNDADSLETTQHEESKADMEMLEYIFKTCRLSAAATKFLFEERKYDRTIVSKLRIRAVMSDKWLAKRLIEQFGEDRAIKSGLVYKWSGQYVSFYHSPCLLFPYFDRNGKLINLQARYLGHDENKPRFQFPVGCKAPIFNLPLLKFLRPGQTLFVSEGVTDCLALLSDKKPAIAIPSATLLKKNELELLAKYRLMMYPDQDAPGQRLYQKIKDGIKPFGGVIDQLPLPEGCKDYSDYFKNKE